MLNEKLTSWEYYYNKLPKYLRDSETFPEHLKIWVEFIQGIDQYADDMLGLIDVFDANYLVRYGKKCDDFLDKLGALYGVRRNFSVTYEEEVEGVPQTIHEELNLTQIEFLVLIRAQIIKNFFDGTYEQLVDFYTKARIPIVYVTVTAGQCDLVLMLDVINDITTESTNIIHMFKSGLLTVESLGIHYNRIALQRSEVLQWGNAYDNNGIIEEDTEGTQWDVGVWVI